MRSGKRSRSIRRKSHYDQVRVLSGWGGLCGAEYPNHTVTRTERQMLPESFIRA